MLPSVGIYSKFGRINKIDVHNRIIIVLWEAFEILYQPDKLKLNDRVQYNKAWRVKLSERRITNMTQ